MDLRYWTNELRADELELDAATRLSNVNFAAQRLQRAKAALRRLEAETAKRPKRTSRGSGPAGASSQPARLRRSRDPTARDDRPPARRAAGRRRPARVLLGADAAGRPLVYALDRKRPGGAAMGGTAHRAPVARISFLPCELAHTPVGVSRGRIKEETSGHCRGRWILRILVLTVA
jgi:hypothetical protein